MAGKSIGLLVIGIILIALIASIVSENTSSQQKTLINEEIKNSSKSISYNELFEHSGSYTGEMIYFRGKIVQVMDGTEDDNANESYFMFTIDKIVQSFNNENEYVLLVATKIDPYTGHFDDIIWVKYKGKRMQENDIVDVWGRFAGLKTEYTDFGTELTIPGMNSLYLEPVEKAGNQ